jgi:tetratricopeptide (TPR) repeat protein
VAENPRIEELRRRVEADPASIAFAALAEEYRRSGAYQDAINTCRVGLQRHPSYLSARVTLGRALLEIGDYAAARQELDTVLKSAPENLAAIRGLAEIDERVGGAQPAPPAVAPPRAPAFPEPSPPPSAAVLARLEALLASIRAVRAGDRRDR